MEQEFLGNENFCLMNDKHSIKIEIKSLRQFTLAEADKGSRV
jgi:hypothetical protein